MMIVVPTERQTFYLSMRSTASDFAALEAEGREIVNKIVAFLDDAGLSSP